MSLTFGGLITMCLNMGLFGFFLFVTFWGFLNLDVYVSFPRLWKFTSIFLNKISAHSSLFFWDVYNACIGTLYRVQQATFTVFHFFFLSTPLIKWLPLPCIWVCRYFLSIYLVCWTLYWIFQLLCSSALISVW